MAYLGGTLIKRFDGFRRLCRQASDNYDHNLSLPDEDLLLVNRTLAALGGPPAAREVRGEFAGDGLALLLLFLLTQELPCRIGLMGGSEATISRLKSLVHFLGHAVYPTIAGSGQLAFQEVVKELGAGGAILKPCFHYDAEGEPERVELTGSASSLGVGPEHGPYTLAVLTGPGAGPAPLKQTSAPFSAAVVILHR